MLDWYLYEVELRHATRLHEAAHDALVQEALRVKQKGSGPIDRALVTIGRLLVDWGRGLQLRHAFAPAPAGTVDSLSAYARPEHAEAGWGGGRRRTQV